MPIFVVTACLFFMVASAGCAKSEGAKLYEAQGCSQCHGVNREGTEKGPPLESLRHLWSDESLETYLRNPQAFVQRDERLRALANRYQTVMPAFVLADQSRKALVKFLLEE